jgi:hypothetical protein
MAVSPPEKESYFNESRLLKLFFAQLEFLPYCYICIPYRYLLATFARDS